MMLWWRKTLSLLLCMQLFACQYVQTKPIDGPFESLVQYLEKLADIYQNKNKQALYEDILKLQKNVKLIKQALNKPPKLQGQLGEDLTQARSFVAANSGRLQAWVTNLEGLQIQMLKLVKQIDKQGHQLTEGSVTGFSLEEISIHKAVVFFGLLYLSELNAQYMVALMPLVLTSLRQSYDQDANLRAFRSQLLDRYFMLIGSSKVLERDLNTLLSNLTELLATGEMPVGVKKSVARSVVDLAKRQGRSSGQIDQAIAELDRDQQVQFFELKAEYEAKLSNVTFLYDPNNPDNFVVSALVVIGNLTWGLINTIIGGGVVLATMLVSPFTKHVDFPTFRWATNGQQVVVDISGMGSMRGKVSLGIFELSNHAGISAMSHHEGGHAKQSALLGPLYLPLVLASYAIQGHRHSFMERWADTWATSVN